MAEYYHNLITEKSWLLLQELKRQFSFVLIGGWAVFLWTGRLKSKDIDLVLDFAELEKMRALYSMQKNERLQKYEVKIEEIDIDIYVPHYSDPGLPAEEVMKQAISREGFLIPRPEILLILKQRAWAERAGTPKGEKDRLDILGLLALAPMDWQFYRRILHQYQREDWRPQLRDLLKDTTAAPELGFNEHQFSRLKKSLLAALN